MEKRHKWKWLEGQGSMHRINWKQVCEVCGAFRGYNVLELKWNVGYVAGEGGRHHDKPWCEQ